MAQQPKKGKKDFPPGLHRGKERTHQLLKSRTQCLGFARPRNAACPGTSRAWQGQRRAAPLSCCQLHAAAGVKAAAGAALEQGGGSRRAPSATSGRRGCNRRRGDDSSGRRGRNVYDGLRPLLSDGELLGKPLQRINGEACLGDWESRKRCLVGLTHICQVQP